MPQPFIGNNMTGDEKTIKILFFGDMVGKPGRYAVRDFLEGLRLENKLPDFVIANVENASHGFGLTEKNYKEIANIINLVCDEKGKNKVIYLIQGMDGASLILFSFGGES